MIENDIRKLKCPFCQHFGHLTIYRELQKLKTDKSLSGYFVAPASDPIIFCQMCGVQYSQITYDIANEVLSYKVIPASIPKPDQEISVCASY